MTLHIRPIEARDINAVGNICYNAFKGTSEQHNFRPDFPSADMAVQFCGSLFESPSVFGVVAEANNAIVGSNFLLEHDQIRAVGPITVDPAAQAKGAGRRLMEAVIERGRGSIGIRLVQDAFNSASLSLYASLGFEVMEPLVLIEGVVTGPREESVEVRALDEGDLEACAELCRRTHGFDRLNELKHTPRFLTSFVALREGRLTAYASAPHFWAVNHAVAETEEDMVALLTGVNNLSSQTLSLLMPIRQASLFRWSLQAGLRVLKPLNLMAMGEYRQPQHPFIPPVGY